MKHFLLVTSLLAIALCTIAQRVENPANNITTFVTGTITGDLQKKPIADVTVSLVNVKDSSLVAFTRTDSSGNFSFANLQPGGFRLSASDSKFHPLWKRFELAANDEALQLGNLLLKEKTVLETAAASKQLMKSKKGEIKIAAFDLLKQNFGVDRNVNSNFVEDIQYETLQRYFTAGFTYSLQRLLPGGPKAVIRTF